MVNHGFNSSFGASYEDDEWELYHVDEDYSEKYNVADQYPEKLKELQEEWLIQAGKYHVYPMPNTGLLASRDQLAQTHSSFELPAQHLEFRHVRYPFDLVSDPGIGVRTNTVTAVLDRKSKEEQGVILAKGDRFGGISIYILDNKLKYVYNLDADTYYVAASEEELPLGKVEVIAQFTVTGKERATVELLVNGKKTAETKVERFHYTTGAGAPTSLKINKHTSVYDMDYSSPFEYNGILEQVVIDVAASAVDAKDELEKALHVD